MHNNLANFDWITLCVLVLLLALWGRYFYKRGRKELSYNISSTQLISPSSELPGKLELLWNGAESENILLVTLEFMNTGNVAIKQEDFDRDFTINFDVKSDVMEIDLLATKPYSLQPEFINHGNSISLRPLKLNPGDMIKTKSLVQNHLAEFSVDFSLKNGGLVRNYISTNYLADKDRTILLVYSVAAVIFSIFLGVYDFNALPRICVILLAVMNINALYFVYRVLLKYK